MITFDIPLLTVLGVVVNVLLPLLVGLVTTRVTSSSTKAILLAGLSLLLQLGTELAAALTRGEPYNLGQGLLLGLVGFALAVSAHYGIYRPTGLTEAALGHGRTDVGGVVPNGTGAPDTGRDYSVSNSAAIRAELEGGGIIKRGGYTGTNPLDQGGVLPRSGIQHVVNNTGEPERIIPASELDDGPDHRKPGPAV